MKILMVIASRNFRDEELLVPKEIFQGKGWSVKIASKNLHPGETAAGMLGAHVTVDIDIAQAKVADYDAIIFVGGPGAATYFNDRTAHMLAWQAYDTGKVVAAICIAPSILANAKVLQGKRATAFPSERENIQSKAADYTGEDVTVANRIVTAKGPSSARKFAEAVIKLLEKK